MKIKILGLGQTKIEDDEGNNLVQMLGEKGVHIEQMVVFIFPDRVTCKADIIFDNLEIDAPEYVECVIKKLPIIDDTLN